MKGGVVQSQGQATSIDAAAARQQGRLFLKLLLQRHYFGEATFLSEKASFVELCEEPINKSFHTFF